MNAIKSLDNLWFSFVKYLHIFIPATCSQHMPFNRQRTSKRNIFGPKLKKCLCENEWVIRLFLISQLKEEEGNKTLLCLPFDSISTGLFKIKAFFSTSRILRSFRSYLTNNNGSSVLGLHLQHAKKNLTSNHKQNKRILCSQKISFGQLMSHHYERRISNFGIYFSHLDRDFSALMLEEISLSDSIFFIIISCLSSFKFSWHSKNSFVFLVTKGLLRCYGNNSVHFDKRRYLIIREGEVVGD